MNQITLGELRKSLKYLPPSKKIEYLHSPHSYRGYYDELAFECSSFKQTTVKNTLKMLDECIGATFEGYKGGKFKMENDTYINVATYGMCGRKIVGINICQDPITILTKEEEAV